MNVPEQKNAVSIKDNGMKIKNLKPHYKRALLKSFKKARKLESPSGTRGCPNICKQYIERDIEKYTLEQLKQKIQRGFEITETYCMPNRNDIVLGVIEELAKIKNKIYEPIENTGSSVSRSQVSSCHKLNRSLPLPIRTKSLCENRFFTKGKGKSLRGQPPFLPKGRGNL